MSDSTGQRSKAFQTLSAQTLPFQLFLFRHIAVDHEDGLWRSVVSTDQCPPAVDHDGMALFGRVRNLASPMPIGSDARPEFSGKKPFYTGVIEHPPAQDFMGRPSVPFGAGLPDRRRSWRPAQCRAAPLRLHPRRVENVQSGERPSLTIWTRAKYRDKAFT